MAVKITDGSSGENRDIQGGNAAGKQNSGGARRGKVLVVDDDVDFRSSVTALLEAQGYVVSGAADGRQALARVASDRPDLIILDIMMENMWAGYEVNRAIKYENGFDALRRIPILMVSSFPIDPTRRFGMAPEMETVVPDGYLTKPLAIPEFLATVEALLGRGSSQGTTHG